MKDFESERAKSDPRKREGGHELAIDPKKCAATLFPSQKVSLSTPTNSPRESPSWYVRSCLSNVLEWYVFWSWEGGGGYYHPNLGRCVP